MWLHRWILSCDFLRSEINLTPRRWSSTAVENGGTAEDKNVVVSWRVRSDGRISTEDKSTAVHQAALYIVSKNHGNDYTRLIECAVDTLREIDTFSLFRSFALDSSWCPWCAFYARVHIWSWGARSFLPLFIYLFFFHSWTADFYTDIYMCIRTIKEQNSNFCLLTRHCYTYVIYNNINIIIE